MHARESDAQIRLSPSVAVEDVSSIASDSSAQGSLPLPCARRPRQAVLQVPSAGHCSPAQLGDALATDPTWPGSHSGSTRGRWRLSAAKISAAGGIGVDRHRVEDHDAGDGRCRRLPAFPCCRAHDLFAPVENYAQAILLTPGDEAYWFDWDSSFHGKATIRIATLGDEVMVFREHRADRYGKVRRFRALLYPEFGTPYTQACERRPEAFEDDILEIADQAEQDYREGKNGQPIPNKELVLRSKIKVEGRQWLMARRNPAQWGDNQSLDVTGNIMLLSPEERVQKALQLFDLMKKFVEPSRNPVAGRPLVYDPGDDDLPVLVVWSLFEERDAMKAALLAIWICLIALPALALPCSTAVGCVHGAPAPIIGAGIPALLGVGGVWLGRRLLKRTRRQD
jgi:hypothetical protein